MAIFNSYVSLPEGKHVKLESYKVDRPKKIHNPEPKNIKKLQIWYDFEWNCGNRTLQHSHFGRSSRPVPRWDHKSAWRCFFFSLSPDNFLVVIPFKIAIYCNQKCWFLVELEPGSSDHRGVLKAMWLKLLNDVESRSNA